MSAGLIIIIIQMTFPIEYLQNEIEMMNKYGMLKSMNV